MLCYRVGSQRGLLSPAFPVLLFGLYNKFVQYFPCEKRPPPLPSSLPTASRAEKAEDDAEPKAAPHHRAVLAGERAGDTGKRNKPCEPKAESGGSGLAIGTNCSLVPSQSLDLHAQMWGRTPTFNKYSPPKKV